MKLRNFLVMMAAGCLATGFTSCDDDDDENSSQSVENLAGDFYGASGMTVNKSTSYDSTCVARLIIQTNGRYSLVLPETTDKVTPEGKGMPGMPTITLKDLYLKPTANNVYTTEIAAITIKDVMAGKNANISDFKLALDHNTKEITLSYGLQYGKMPLTIQYEFNTLTQNDYVVGDFFGNNAAHVGKEEMPDSAVIATIDTQKNGKYTLTLPAKAKDAKGMELPTVKITDVEIKADANTYTFAIDETKINASGMVIVIKDLKGNVHGNKLKLTYEMKPGKMPMFVSNNFEGGKMNK